jgi:predicted DNA-binding WGR domain protein
MSACDNIEAQSMTPVQIDIEDWLAAQEPHPSYYVWLRRIDPARNMARFYRVGVQRDLFGTWCFVRGWGRIGQGGQTRTIPCVTPAEAHAALEKQRHAKERRGYVRA